MPHRAFGCAPPVAPERLSGRAGRSFVEAARQHVRTRWKFRAGTSCLCPAHLNRIASDTRTTGHTTRRFLVDSSSRSETPPLFASIEKITLITPDLEDSFSSIEKITLTLITLITPEMHDHERVHERSQGVDCGERWVSWTHCLWTAT